MQDLDVGLLGMCTRFLLYAGQELLRAYFGVEGLHSDSGEVIQDYPPRYNIAPRQPVLVIHQNNAHKKQVHFMLWGLVPSWAKDPDSFSILANARSESLLDKPSFKSSARYRRCLVPASGFYEWKRVGQNHKQPYYFYAPDQPVLAFAAIWDHWLGADGSEFESVALLTTKANKAVARVHHRMPVIIKPEDFDLWLESSGRFTHEALALARPAENDMLRGVEIGEEVNHPGAEGKELIIPKQASLF